MNDRELYCRGKASELRSAARMTQSAEARRALAAEAAEWERQADEAAGDSHAAERPSDPPPTPDQHA